MSEQTAEDFFESHGLDIPSMDLYNEEAVKEIGEWHWATTPTPTPMQDYLLESVEYLKGAVPDQYSVSHAGHGMNSYSLNFRCVSGEFAILAQVGWGGAYGDPVKDTQAWNDLCLRLTSILVQSFQEDNRTARERKYLLVYSDFRLENSFELWERKGGKWQENKDFADFDDACRYLIAENQ